LLGGTGGVGPGMAGLLQRIQGVVELAGVEQARQPAVQTGKEIGLAQVDGAGMVEPADRLVLGRAGAAVIGLVMDPVALQAAPADTAAQPLSQQVGPVAGGGRAGLGTPGARGDRGLNGVEGVLGDQRLVGMGVVRVVVSRVARSSRVWRWRETA
jgi:hypothetical protein